MKISIIYKEENGGVGMLGTYKCRTYVNCLFTKNREYSPTMFVDYRLNSSNNYADNFNVLRYHHPNVLRTERTSASAFSRVL